MTKDSSTHIHVNRNGIDHWLLRQTWDAIGGDSNKDGYTRLPSEPAEVIAMKQKVEVAPKEPAVIEVIGAKSEVIEEKPKKVKK